MQHVAIVVGTTAYYLATAGAADIAGLTRLMATARDARFDTESKNHATPEIIAAWRKWYVEAIASVDRLR